MIELIYFCLILTVAIFACAVSTHAMMFGRQEPSIEILRQLFFPTFWKTTGPLYTKPLMYFASLGMCTDSMVYGLYDSCPDQLGSMMAIIVYIFYHLSYNVLLLNILIAIFK
jgi:hypothetical protein